MKSVVILSTCSTLLIKVPVAFIFMVMVQFYGIFVVTGICLDSCISLALQVCFEGKMFDSEWCFSMMMLLQYGSLIAIFVDKMATTLLLQS